MDDTKAGRPYILLQDALQFFQRVPRAIVSDNLKSAVNRARKYEAEVNQTFKDFARHYNCVINPTQSYAAQDTALVELTSRDFVIVVESKSKILISTRIEK